MVMQALIELSSSQQKKLQYIAEHLPARLPGNDVVVNDVTTRFVHIVPVSPFHFAQLLAAFEF